jgi:FkbH-like protein
MPPEGRLPEAAPASIAGTVSPETPCLAVSATFTADAILPVLRFWLRELGLGWSARLAPYNQVFQQLLDPSSLLGRNAAGVNILLVRFQDWGGDAVHHARRLAEALRSTEAPVLVAICPPAPGYEVESRRAEEAMRLGATGTSGIHLLAPVDVAGLYPVEDIHDPRADELGHVPYTPLYFAALGTALIRKVHAIRSAPYKVIALDCDDTLWQGICGEDGAYGVKLDPPRRFLQEFMAAQRDAGMLLALCSKNNEEDVLQTFSAHPYMPLGWDDFAARRINWEPKAQNLSELAEELQLGLDTFILVDDNPKECTEAQSGCPEVLVLPLPSDAREIRAFLRHVWVFDRARVTTEDRQRAAMYAQQAERVRLERSAPSLEDFLASLRLVVTIGKPGPDQWSRVAQLTQRTNQMNLTCVRRTETEVERLPGAECLAVEVSDRFGSYGLTGVMIYRVEAPALVVDTFLLSCRVLGRGVEHRMLAYLGRTALDLGLDSVVLPFAPAQRNKPAQLFLESVAQAFAEGIYHLDAATAAAVRYRPSPAQPAAHRPPDSAADTRSRIDYRRIASELRDVSRILACIEGERPPVPPGSAAVPAGAPRTPMESGLARLWSDLLRRPAVGIEENFFELGGHSLLAVQLLSRVHQIYGVDLSLEVVYGGEFTVAALARAIELKEIEQAAGSDYQELLQEIEQLSDEEVRALLEREQGQDFA